MLVRRPNLDYKIVHKIIHDTSRCFHSPVARGSSRLRRAAVESGLLGLLRSDWKDTGQPELHFRSGNLHTRPAHPPQWVIPLWRTSQSSTTAAAHPAGTQLVASAQCSPLYPKEAW